MRDYFFFFIETHWSVFTEIRSLKKDVLAAIVV